MSDDKRDACRWGGRVVSASEIDIAAIRARLRAATPGPWVDYGLSPQHPNVSDVSSCSTGNSVAFVYGASAALVAHAPTDLAALCDVVESQDVALKDLCDAAARLLAVAEKLRVERDRLREITEGRR